MKLAFMTKRDANGHRKYLEFDTNERVYARMCRYAVPDGIEVKAADLKRLLNEVKSEGFTELD